MKDKGENDMEQEVNFRSSVGGYKKDDVIEYVEIQMRKFSA